MVDSGVTYVVILSIRFAFSTTYYLREPSSTLNLNSNRTVPSTVVKYIIPEFFSQTVDKAIGYWQARTRIDRIHYPPYCSLLIHPG